MPFDVRLKTPFNMMLSGPTGAGKTTWVKNLLKVGDDIFDVKPVKVYLFYRVMQDMYVTMRDENLVQEFIDVSKKMPTIDDYNEWTNPHTDSGGTIFIFDDSISDINKDFEYLFCNLSHHKNISVIFLTQNMFYRNPTFRLMSLNTHYFVALQNIRDKQQISILGRQFSPGNSNFLTDVMQEATKRPFGYIFVDFKPNTAPALRVLSNILPHEFPIVVYLENKH